MVDPLLQLQAPKQLTPT